MDPNLVRVDPSLHEADYEGLEGDLRVSEKLVEEANQYYATVAQRQWDIAEKRDMDMAEEGVERLGDLVASGWFERNQKDGALRELMEKREENETHEHLLKPPRSILPHEDESHLGRRWPRFTALPLHPLHAKTLLPLHNRPVIDYALGTIRRAGIKDITIISNQFVGQIASHVGQGLPGERIHYVIEEEPLGVAHALNLARPYNEDARLMVYFSDNITTIEFGKHVKAFTEASEPPAVSRSPVRKNIQKRLALPYLMNMSPYRC